MPYTYPKLHLQLKVLAICPIRVYADHSQMKRYMKLAFENIIAVNTAYCVDNKRVLHGVACLLHVSNPLKLFLVIFAVYILILGKDKIKLLKVIKENCTLLLYRNSSRRT